MGAVPASNIPLPTRPPVSIPLPTRPAGVAGLASGDAVIASSLEKIADAGSLAFEIEANLRIELDNLTYEIPVNYAGDFRFGGYAAADVSAATPERVIEARVITFAPLFFAATHVLESSSEGWDTTYGNSPYYIDLTGLVGGTPDELIGLGLTGQETLDGMDIHVLSGKLQGLEIAGAWGDFSVVYRIGVDDGLVREVFAFGDLEVNDDVTLIGDTDADTASIELTARLFDHGKRVDIVTPGLSIPRFEHETALLDDGRVLLGGGFTGIANNNVLVPIPFGLVQIYDSEAGTWTASEPPQGPGILFEFIKLTDGRALALGLGGFEGEIGAMASVFDPVTNSWSELPPSPLARGLPSTFLLNDGRVLVVGGIDFSSMYGFSPEYIKEVEIFDTETGEWQMAASPTQVFEEQPLFSLLSDGRVMVMGQVDDGSFEVTTRAEIYDPAIDTWTPISSVEPYYAIDDAVALSDGRLLVVGGLSLSGQTSTVNGRLVWRQLPDGRNLNAKQIAEQFPAFKIYDPDSDTWTPAGETAYIRPNLTLTLLPDGRVLAAGGEDGWGKDFLPYSTTEIFDPRTNSWTLGPDLSDLRAGSSATLLSDGKVLLAGGIGMALDIEEIYPHRTSEIVDPNAPPGTAPPAAPTQPPAATLWCVSTATSVPTGVLTPAPPSLSPLTILQAANDAMAAADSYHVDLDLETAGHVEGNNLSTAQRIIMDFQAPDSLRACVTPAAVVLADFHFYTLIVGGVRYDSDSADGVWETSEWLNPFAGLPVFNEFLADHVVADLRGLSVDGMQTLNGASVYRFSGTLPTATLSSLTQHDHQGELQVAYWVGVDDSLVRRFTADGILEYENIPNVNFTMTIDISGFGQEVVIEAPEVGNTP